MELRVRLYGGVQVIGTRLGGPVYDSIIVEEGILSDERAESNYGLPVYVGPDGLARSPMELPEGTRHLYIIPHGATLDETHGEEDWARRAGFSL